ncbi:exodeoxyribonuclease VII large subunit [soil metagenome]
MSDKTWTPSQIGARIEQVVSQKMAALFWVRGEVADLSRTARGAVFLSLVETDDTNQVVASLPTTMSPGKGRLVDRRMARVGQPLSDGMQVRIRGRLDYYVRGGRLSLSLDDVDPAHTAGAMAVARRALLRALQTEGLMRANEARTLSRLPLRLGLITSGGSRAFHDVVEELAASRLPFAVTVAAVNVQCVRAPAQVTAALNALGTHADIDLILLSRGGGAEVELATFDDSRVARAVANCPRQVWTGIGHHLDQPVAELVAAQAFKTPTALAQGIVSQVNQAVDSVEDLWTATRRASLRRIGQATGRLDLAATGLRSGGQQVIQTQRHRLDTSTRQLKAAAGATVATAQRRLDTTAALTDAYDPKRLLQRGWSVTATARGDLVTKPVAVGTKLVTTTRGGKISSEVTDE